MPKIDIDAIEWKGGSSYPQIFQAQVDGRLRKRLGNACGLEQFGVNITRLAPGSTSALRHWHEQEDEFIFVLEGELVLIEDEGETVLTRGECAGFKAGLANGHHLVNRSGNDTYYLEIGTRAATEKAHYPDDDLVGIKNKDGFQFTRKSGDPYK